MNLFYQPNISNGIHTLDKDETRHIRVLRKKIGDSLCVTDGKGSFYEVTITQLDSNQCSFSIDQQRKVSPRSFSIHIAIAPTKNQERIEWFVEKACEIGIDQISFIRCDRSERPKVKVERMYKIALSAIKQSLKATLPQINELISLNNFLAQASASEKYIAYVDPENPHHLQSLATKGKSYLLLIGPEGDFTPSELTKALSQGFKKVSLGESRLRTETAGMVGCHILSLINL